MQSHAPLPAVVINKQDLHVRNIESTHHRQQGVSSPQSPKSAAAKTQQATLRQTLVVIGAFAGFMNTSGLLVAFGSFQDYYQRELLADWSRSDLAWITTVCAFLLLFAGVITGPAYDKGYLRPLLLVGSLLETFGMMMLSLSTEYYQVFLSQGICVGLGAGMLYVPVLSATATSFTNPQTRAKAMGLIASGGGIGGVIYLIMFDRLLPQLGFGWTVRVMAFLMFGTYLFSYPMLFYTSPRSAEVRRFIDVSALREPSFVCLWLSGFFADLAYYIPLIFLPLFAQTHIPDLSNSTLATDLLAIINGTMVPARVGCGLIAAMIGPGETLLGALVSITVVSFSWIAVDSVSGVVVWSIFWGLTTSLLPPIPSMIISLQSPSVSVVGTRNGMFCTSIALGSLIGGPIAGALTNSVSPGHKGPSWWPVQVFAGLMWVMAAALAVVPVIVLRRQKSRI